MLKVGSKRRRTKFEKAQEDYEALQKENEVRSKLARLAQVEIELERANQAVVDNKNAAVLLSDLVVAGVIKEESENTFVVNGQNGEQRFNYN